MMKLSALVVAHNEEARLADCLEKLAFADEIVVVEDGQIVERGSHTDLLEHRGVYAQLHKMQFGE